MRRGRFGIYSRRPPRLVPSLCAGNPATASRPNPAPCCARTRWFSARAVRVDCRHTLQIARRDFPDRIRVAFDWRAFAAHILKPAHMRLDLASGCDRSSNDAAATQPWDWAYREAPIPSIALSSHSATGAISSFRGLFPSERVLHAADGVLDLAHYLAGLSVRLHLGVTDTLPTACLTAPVTCFADPSTRCLSITSSSKSLIAKCDARRRAPRLN
jgi:hypothetical protein